MTKWVRQLLLRLVDCQGCRRQGSKESRDKPFSSTWSDEQKVENSNKLLLYVWRRRIAWEKDRVVKYLSVEESTHATLKGYTTTSSRSIWSINNTVTNLHMYEAGDRIPPPPPPFTKFSEKPHTSYFLQYSTNYTIKTTKLKLFESAMSSLTSHVHDTEWHTSVKAKVHIYYHDFNVFKHRIAEDLNIDRHTVQAKERNGFATKYQKYIYVIK